MDKRERLIGIVAGAAHEDWRRAWRDSHGDAPRIKKTRDAGWIARHRTDEVDLAASDYAALPEDWQRESRASAEVAVDRLLDAIADPHRGRGRLDGDFMESTAARIHEAWLARNRDHAPPEQRRPYSELSEADKSKDRLYVQRAIDALDEP